MSDTAFTPLVAAHWLARVAASTTPSIITSTNEFSKQYETTTFYFLNNIYLFTYFL